MKKDFEQISKMSGFMHHNGGLYFREISEKKYEFKTTIKDFHLNKRDITHGGFICSLIDAGAGTAVYRTTGQKSCVTVSLDIKFIAPSRINDEITGEIQILKKTNSMVFVNCNLKKKDQLVASAIGVWKVVKKI
mgnify:CR=1 FL=1|tara:strand:- start:371 stop:772 length:402 start_codon:yes stop_codon:yes gene_type:complete